MREKRRHEALIVTNYSMNTKLGLRLALVTDLHNKPCGRLIRLLENEEPDAILVAGDTLERHKAGESKWTNEVMEQWQLLPEMNSPMNKLMQKLDRIVEHSGVEDDENKDYGLAFLKKASRIAPIFMSVGNHEWYFRDSDYRFFQSNDITLLDNSEVEANIAGHKILIGGLSTRYDLNWLKAFSEMDGYKILLCHHPEHYRYKIKGKTMDTFELVVSGHYHGGQWRIGDIGVYVPRVGIFAPNVRGKYGKHVISAGVSNTTKFPRFGNPRELVMIEV